MLSAYFYNRSCFLCVLVVLYSHKKKTFAQTLKQLCF